MRKIVVLEFLSLDGVMQAPGGPEEDTSDGFKYGGWTVPYFDDFAGKIMAEQMNKKRLIFSILAILFGAFMVVYGGMDDSPGGQLLGLLSIVGGVVGVIKGRKRTR